MLRKALAVAVRETWPYALSAGIGIRKEPRERLAPPCGSDTIKLTYQLVSNYALALRRFCGFDLRHNGAELRMDVVSRLDRHRVTTLWIGRGITHDRQHVVERSLAGRGYLLLPLAAGLVGRALRTPGSSRFPPRGIAFDCTDCFSKRGTPAIA